MAETTGDQDFQFVVMTTKTGPPKDAATKLAVRKKAMKAAAATRKMNGTGLNPNRLQYPPDVSPPRARQPNIHRKNGSAEQQGTCPDKTTHVALGKDSTRFSVNSSQETSLTRAKRQSPNLMHRDLMAMIAARQQISPSISAQGFELLSMKYGFDPLNLSALTTLHIGRTALNPFSVKISPSRLTKIFLLQQHSYMSFIPERYNRSQCLNDAADCLYAVTRQLCASPQNADSWALTTRSLYGRALQSLHRAINDEDTRFDPETLCATQMMAMIELLNSSPDDTRFLHVEAASHLIKQRGPEGFKSDFEKAILSAHARDTIINALLTGRSCFLEEENWQLALLQTVDSTLNAIDRSETVATLWLCHARLPGLFRAVDQTLNNNSPIYFRQSRSAMRRIKSLLADLWSWRSKWTAVLDNYYVPDGDQDTSTKKECDKRREVIGMFLSCLILANRLHSTLDRSNGKAREQQTQEAARQILDLQDEANRLAPQGDFFMTQAITISLSVINTKAAWMKALDFDEDVIQSQGAIEPTVYRAWSTMLGRRTPNSFCFLMQADLTALEQQHRNIIVPNKLSKPNPKRINQYFSNKTTKHHTMSSPLTVDALLSRHSSNLPNWTPIPTFAEIGAAGGELPHIMVITCADPRCIPENFLHLNTGEVLILRKVGGHSMGTVSDIVALDNLVTVSDIVVVQHTDCGTTMFKDQDVKDVLKERCHGKGLDGEIEGMGFGERIGTIEESVKRSVEYLKASPFIREELKAKIRGMWFDLKSGDLTPVPT